MKGRYILKSASLICLSIIIASSLLLGCFQKNSNKFVKLSGTITVWSWNEELITSGIIEEFQKQYPGIKINLINVPSSDNAYANRLVATLQSGVNAPDVFLSEAGVIPRITKMNVCENLSQEPYNAEDLTGNMVPYTVEAGRDKDGNLVALTWQVTPGGYYYRRSLAKKYLGTDNPEEIQEMMNSMDDFIKLGETIRDKSNGQVYFLGGKQELMRIALANRKDPWVKDNKIIIDPAIEQSFDMTAKLINENIAYNASQWSVEWADSMADGNVFGFVLPTWGISNTIPGNAPDTKGDWGFVKAPVPYFWGGTWASIYKGSENKVLSWEFIKFLTTNEEFLQNYANKTGDFVNNKTLQEKMSNSNEQKNEFLGGQNPYKSYSTIVDKIDFSNSTEYDDAFNDLWMECLSEYIRGEITREMVDEVFKNKVKQKYNYLE